RLRERKRAVDLLAQEVDVAAGGVLLDRELARRQQRSARKRWRRQTFDDRMSPALTQVGPRRGVIPQRRALKIGGRADRDETLVPMKVKDGRVGAHQAKPLLG